MHLPPGGGTGSESGVSTQAEAEDITDSGLDLSEDAPAEKTTYQAGTGTVTYDPDSQTLTLNNAAIETSGDTITAPKGILNIVVEGENTLTSTGANAVSCSEDTTDVNISGTGTLNINAEGCGITDDYGKSAASIEGTTVNFKCGDDAVNVRNAIVCKDAMIDVQAQNTSTYGPNAFYSLYGEIHLDNSSVTAEDVYDVFAAERGPLVLENKSTVKANARHGANIYPGEGGELIQINDSVFELNSSAAARSLAFCFEGDVEIKESTVTVKSTSKTAMDGEGTLVVSGNSYVELEGTAKALNLTSPLEMNDGLTVLEGEMAEDSQSSTTARLVIGKPYKITAHDCKVLVDGEEADTAAPNKTVTLQADDTKDGGAFLGWQTSPTLELEHPEEGVETTVTFTMPSGDVEVWALYDIPDEEPADGTGGVVATVVLGTAAAGAAALAVYGIGTELYFRANLPGLLIPSNREELALTIWEKVGKPEPASAALYSDIAEDADDAQKAARWMVEQGLMRVEEEQTDIFKPLQSVTRLRVCLTWQDAKDKGLIK